MEPYGVALLAMSAIALLASIVLFFRPVPAAATPAQREAGLADITKLIEAVTKLVEALQKAGPALALLTASIVFAISGVALLAAEEAGDAASDTSSAPADS